MNWNKLTDISELDKINIESNTQRIMLFKHSTRCSISATALNRLERSWQETDFDKITPYYLDLINHRNISNEIADMYDIEHQSPQILLIENGKCIYSESHTGISYDELFDIH